MADFEKYEASDFRTNNVQGYNRILADMLRDRQAGPRYRAEAFDRIAGQTRAAESAIQEGASQAYGFNPAGQTSALVAQQRAKAPYAAADLAAREHARQSSLQTGQALLQKKMGAANWYTTMLQPYFNDRSLDLQKMQIENMSALGLAGMGGGGSDATSSIIGAVGSLGSAAIIAGLL